MAKQIPSTLRDALSEEPERFLQYLNIEKILKARNPYQTFLRQFERAFGQKQGLNLFQYIVNRYALLNELYKNIQIQKKLPDEFVGPLSREQTTIFFEKRTEKIREKQEAREEEVRAEKPRRHEYSQREQRFILTRRGLPLRELAYEFNKSFGTSQTRVAIRDKRLRLLGRKV